MSTRREFLSRSVTSVAELMALGVLLPSVARAEGSSAPEKTKEEIAVTREFVSASKEFGGLDVLGLRQNDAWQAANGCWYIVYERVILERLDNGRIQAFAALDVMHNSKLDDHLDSGKFGVTIPRMTSDFDPTSFRSVDLLEERLKHVTMSSDLRNLIAEYKSKGLYVGMPTSEYKDYGAYKVWRFQNMAFMQWKETGLIEGVLIGNVAYKVGMVPQDKQTLTPQLDLEPELKQQERFSPSSRGLDLEGCEKTNWTMRGEATYYDLVYDPATKTMKGCLGCSDDLRMMNGEVFDPNKLTTAINIDVVRQLLGKKILFQNPETGVGVITRVTDSGGFGHLADMSRATAIALGYDLRRGKFPIIATVLNC